ncbi:expressed unknown protein [Seminavis robusta]|uniref:Uncharacterized protein n=1 Tax=Seminavis robusta TaxID=568900 RepID=A0A9N8DIE1_9STRA|nr:expressed unknown protein [Seminavis robusta]|eukprot:Sro80_g042980.1 n/a (231) ;mRNA; f:35571-36263
MTSRMIIGRNNMAVVALQQGRHRDALGMLRTATMQLNELYQRGEDDDEKVVMRTGADGKARVSCRSLRSCDIGTSGPAQSSNVDDDCLSMFRRAIVLSRRETSLPVIASSVLYNLGLCEHVIGANLNISRKIVAALKFYKMSYQIIEENRHRCSFGDLLVLAVINNIADVSSTLQDSNKSRRWFKFLARILGVANSNSRSLPALDEADYAFFYMNAMLHDGEMLNVAAAA